MSEPDDLILDPASEVAIRQNAGLIVDQMLVDPSTEPPADGDTAEVDVSDDGGADEGKARAKR